MKSIVLEVGMSDGFDTQRLIERWGLPIYGFEPVPAMYEHTSKRFKDNVNVHVMHAAVDIEDAIKPFHLSNPQGVFTDGTGRKIHPYGCSSLYEFADDIHQKWKGRPDFNMVETVNVKTIRLDTFLDQIQFDGEIEYMHCDAQGNDVNVLKSLGKYLPRLKQGVIEVAASVELYKNTNNNIEQATKFLTQNGFIYQPPNKTAREADIRFRRA